MIDLKIEGETDCSEISWEFLTDDLTELMREVAKRYKYYGYWFAEVHCFGWRCQNGEKTFKAETGDQLLYNILPKCNCTFKIFKKGNEIQIQNFHHDSPVGREWYFIRHLTAKEVENWKG